MFCHFTNIISDVSYPFTIYYYSVTYLLITLLFDVNYSFITIRKLSPTANLHINHY